MLERRSENTSLAGATRLDRLKLLESDFGCWLETVCDYLFYFFLLVGMTNGQLRTSGSKAYLLWGALLLLGALASFLALGWQRQPRRRTS